MARVKVKGGVFATPDTLRPSPPPIPHGCIGCFILQDGTTGYITEAHSAYANSSGAAVFEFKGIAAAAKLVSVISDMGVELEREKDARERATLQRAAVFSNDGYNKPLLYEPSKTRPDATSAALRREMETRYRLHQARTEALADGRYEHAKRGFWLEDTVLDTNGNQRGTTMRFVSDADPAFWKGI